MKKLVLLGGGRWARVLMSVLANVLPTDWQILWVTQHGRRAAELWCGEQGANAARPKGWIEIASQVSHAQLLHMQAAIVATSPHTHADWLRRLLNAQVPTLCEKPLVLDPHQAEELECQAVAVNCPLGVNVELHYASYMQHFARLVSDLDAQRAAAPATSFSIASSDNTAQSPAVRLSARHVELQWLDPWSEVRYGETKYSDVYTNIVDDMFPHCWSLLRHVTGVDDWSVEQVEYTLNSDVQISLRQGDISAHITLSRRAPQRTRRLSVRLSPQTEHLPQGGSERHASKSLNSGVGNTKTVPSDFTAEIDFSREPGFVVQDGQRQELQWEGERPLTRSINSFLEVIDGHRSSDHHRWHSWPLSIVACRHSVRVSSAIAGQLHRAQQRWLDHCMAGDQVQVGASEDSFRRRLWFDMFIPMAAAAGQRVEFTDPPRLQEFFDSIAQRSHQAL